MAYDYSLRTGKSVVELRENYDTMIHQLKDYFEGQVIANRSLSGRQSLFTEEL